MIFDIFSKIKKRNKKSDEGSRKPSIIVDTREKNSLIIANLSNEAIIELKQLEIGDYLIGKTILERKTFSDFISSMLSRRLIEQLKNMQEYESRILILEGKDFESLEKAESKLNPNAIRGMLLSISLDWNTPIIFTKDEEDTSKFLLLLAKRQLKEKDNQEISLHAKKPSSKKEQKEYVIESFPNIGPKTAKELLKKFKSVKNIINAGEEELKEAIGKKAESFKIVDENY